LVLEKGLALRRFEPFLVQIPRLHRPSLEQFEQDYLLSGRPVVLTGLVPTWPSWGKWNLSWFEKGYGSLTLSGYPPQAKCEMPVRQALKDIRAEKQSPYLAALPVEKLPGMAEQILVPPYCPSDRHTQVLVGVGSPGTFPEFHKDNHTPLDGRQNLLAQMVGRRQSVLVSPDFDAQMYAAPQAANDYLRSQLRWDAPDPERFPLFEGVPYHETTLGPDEMLFIPAHWWHTSGCLEVSMAVTFRWRASRFLELLGQFKLAAKEGRLQAFLARNQGVLGARDLQELGGPEDFAQLWKPLSSRVREYCRQMLDLELLGLVDV